MAAARHLLDCQVTGKPLETVEAARPQRFVLFAPHDQVRHPHTQRILRKLQHRHLAGKLSGADIIVAAVGVPKFVKAEWVKPGAIVIDVGINRLEDGRLCGDVDTDAVAAVAGCITPVPGGDGPMTVATLLENTLLAADLHTEDS